MYTLALIGTLISAASDFGPAPPDTIDPPAAFRQVKTLFSNCEFSGKQIRTSRLPDGSTVEHLAEVDCMTCGDATVIRSKLTAVNPDGSGNDRVAHTERRWMRNAPRLQTNLRKSASGEWPHGDADQGSPFIDTVLAQPRRENEEHLIWEDVPAGEFLGELDLVSGITFADMVSENGSLNFRLISCTWASEDQSRITYRFESEDFGSTDATFELTEIGWMPVLIHIRKSAEHKVVSDARLGSRNLVGNFRTFKEFSDSDGFLDRTEVIYRLAYKKAPTSISTTTIRTCGHEEMSTISEFEFETFDAGNTTCEDVNNQMLPHPDETPCPVSAGGTEKTCLGHAGRPDRQENQS